MNIFDLLIFQPIFNLLVSIYALIPGNDFGVAIILFTVIIRFLMWPMVKKQLHQTKVMRKIQPEIKELRQKHKGNRQAESMALMELYKRHGVNPFSSIGLLLVQLPVFIGLFSALRQIINDPQVLAEKTYGFVQNLPHMQDILADISTFDPTFLGIVDTTEYAYRGGEIVWAAMIIAVLAGVFQYLQTKQLQPQEDKKKHKSIRQIMAESKDGKEPDMSELNAATARRMGLFMPVLIFIIAANSPAGLAIYFATGAAVGYTQQRFVLNRDVQEMEEMKITTTVKTEDSATKKKAKPKRKKK